MERAQPSLVALEHPPGDAAAPPAAAAPPQQQQQQPGAGAGAGSDAVAPPVAPPAGDCPPWVARFLERFDATVCEANLSPALPSRAITGSSSGDGDNSDGEAALRAALEAAAGPEARAARVGRDIVDPDELFGLYPHSDFARAPERVLDAWRLLGEFGFLPGMEHVAAAQLAAPAGARLLCVDAPLALQERWVAALVADFEERRRREPPGGAAALQFGLLRDAHALEARTPAGWAEWDARLGTAFAGTGAGALLAFKLSRAAAAATLAPQDLAAAVSRLRRLQPLKWAHFARREAHVAWRLREACEELARAHAGSGGDGSGGSNSSGTSGSGGGPAIVAVVGRQHFAALQALWRDKAGPLWRDEMPREPAPSAIEERNRRAEAAAEARASAEDAAAAAAAAAAAENEKR